MPKSSISTPRLTLGLQVFMLTATLVILAVAGSVSTTLLLGRGVAHQAVTESLERSAAVQSDFADYRLDELYLRASTVSNDPNFIAYMVDALENQDPASLMDQLDERQRDLGFDFAIILDLDGQSVARTDVRGVSQDLSDIPLFQDAVDSGEYSSLGIWARDDASLYSAVLVPLVKSGILEGYLLAAYQIDDTMALDLRRMTATEVVFLTRTSGDALPSPAAGTLDSAEAEELAQWLKNQPLAEESAVEVSLGSRRYLATARPIRDPLDNEVGRVLNLGSLDDALEPFQRISNILAIVGLITALLALPISFFLPRKLLEPLRRLADAADAAARGDLDQTIHGTDRRDEVGQMADAFDSLLAELRETRDMQVYLRELSRTLPDQEKAGNESLPPRGFYPTIVGLELRQYSGSGQLDSTPKEMLDHLSHDLRRLSRSVVAHGGSIEAASGHRLIAVFEGDRHAERALSGAAEIISMGKSLPLAVVITGGRAATGTVTWHKKPIQALTGSAVEEMEELLRASRPGTLLMSRSAFLPVAELLQELKLTPQEHRAEWAREPIYSIGPDQLARLAVPEARATIDITGQVGSTTGGLGHITLTNIGPGNVLGNRFEILSELGAGGMGVVFKARDQELNELVALKMLKHDAFAGDSKGLNNLKGELKMARKISHPNVLRTFDFGDADGFPFISMEFVRGVTLKHLLEQSGRLPLSAGLHMARQLCRGLHAAHEQSVLHRDIKPENMIIEPTGNVKLMDFGIAQPIRRLKGDETNEGPIVGTPFYLAPEQLEGKEPDERADIYACGVVLYEIFTGSLPFSGGNNLMQIISQKMNEDPPPPSSKAEVPQGLETIIMRCLERDRDRRYPRVIDLLTALENLRG